MASINYAVTDNWGSGFVGNMTVPGGNQGLHGWTVEFDASFAISDIWGAEIVSHIGNHYVIRNLDWNSDVAAGGATSFGFQATPGAGGTVAASLTVNGTGTFSPPPLPTLSIVDASINEGNTGTSSKLSFTISLSQAAAGPVSVSYVTGNGTAMAGSDYVAKSGTLTFAAGETSKVVKVRVAGDSSVESNETLAVTLSNATGANIARGSATGTIVNDDPAPVAPSLSIADATVSEGGSGRHDLAFTVSLSAPAMGPVTVAYGTADGTATAGSDYTAHAGTLTFAAGETAKVVHVRVLGDTVVEGNETLAVKLSSPTGATIAHGTATGTIVNDDVALPVLPSLSISDSSVVEGNPGSGVGAFGWLSTSGNQIVDASGHSVQIAGVNWFGFESSTLAPHGLWTRGYKDMMDQMVSLGFNTIRLPFSSEMLHTAATPNGIDFSKNPDLQGLSAIQIMDKIVDYAGQVGLKIILDHHRSESGAGTSDNGLWYDAQHSQVEWVSDWQMLASRYADKPQVIGADLHNEPYNGTWGGGGPNDWAAAAELAGNAIGHVNPNWLVFVEGVGTYQGQSYWWGGNLMGVKDRPIQLDVANKLVYSAHDYPNSVYPQTWFQSPDFAAQLPAKFDQMWGYIYKQGIAPVYLGEFGTNLSDPKDAPWLKAITSYLGGDLNNDGTRDIPAGNKGISWTFWAWNPNSGDTGGILGNDWNSVNQAKLDYLKPIEFDFGSAVTGPTATNHADFVLTLSQPASGTVTVDFHTVAGDATTADFTASSGSVTFAAGEQSKTISIPITADKIGEANEHFTVVLTNASGATISRATGTGTIIDDDGGVAPPATPPVTPPASDPSAWSAGAIYTAGMTATEGGVTYRANWWNQATDPAQNSGYASGEAPWTIISGTPAPTSWSATTVYTAGLTAIEDGVIYKANWWTQGTDPAHNSGSGQPWTVVAAVDPAHAVPTVPTDFAANVVSTNSTLLSWHASTVPGNLPVTGYTVFENGHQIATTTATNYSVTNLAPDATYQFSVAALDAAGSSAEAAPISVHTTAASPGGGHAHEFTPYIDMAMSQDADLAAISHASGIQNFTLAFMLSSDHGIGWQGAGTISDDTLFNGTTILQEVQAIQAQGGRITISFGGAAGQEAALTAPNAATLQAEYQSVVDRYHVDSIDFDIEGSAVADQHSITLRDQALVGLQAANPNLKVSFTLPVLPDGLVASGLNVLQSAQHDGVKIDVVNIMAMDYGSSVDNNGQMGLDAVDATVATEAQLHNLGLDAKIGVTPMIGVNDIASEVFTLADAQALVNFAQGDANVVRLSMWSVARDNGNTAGAHYSTPDSSGVAQTPNEYAGIFHHFDVTA